MGSSPSQPHSSAALLELRIKDFAIIHELTLQLDDGLNALTGETGAGKSILIDALGAVLGGRVSPAMVRAGAGRALIEATFSRPAQLPDELELDPEDDVVILSREIGGSRGAARINGRTVPLSVLQVAGRALVDIHGQSDHQSLLRAGTHVYFLDRFGGLKGQREHVAALVRDLQQARQELDRLRSGARDAAQRQDLLRFQVEEIGAAGLAAGEEDELAARRGVLANAEKLRQAAAAAVASLNDEGQALDALSSAAKQVTDAARLDAALEPEAEHLERAIDLVHEASRALTRYADALDADPEELARVDDRLDLIRGLKRKYGDSVEEVLAFGDRARAELDDVEGADSRIGELESAAERLQVEALAAAEALSAARQACARRLATEVEAQLADLNMASARFVAQVRSRPESSLNATGIDDVEFLLAANPGEPPRPLVQVASGGEASRLMLALKSVFSASDDTPVLVFDEIEVGVGARGGHVIGDKLRQLAQHHQVLCITHLAPVAARAAAHFRVRKVVDGQRTTTAVDRLDGDERLDELAEMLAGRPVTDAARASARELLAQA